MINTGKRSRSDRLEFGLGLHQIAYLTMLPKKYRILLGESSVDGAERQAGLSDMRGCGERGE
jgi:hypothetical protein